MDLPSSTTPWTVPRFRLLVRAVLLGWIVLAAPPVVAAPPAWVAATPSGGAIYALAAAPSAPQIVYAGSRAAGVFRSADGGVTWEARNASIPDRDLWIVGLAVDATDPDLVYAVPVAGPGADSLLRSLDGGLTWQVMRQAPPINQLIVDPGDRGGRSRRAALLAGSDTGLYRSRDAGFSWERIAFAGSFVNAIAAEPRRPSLLLAVVFEGNTSAGKVWRSRDGGSTWRPTPLAADDLTGLTPDPVRAGTFYVLGDLTIYQTANDGAAWTTLPPLVYAPSAIAASAAGVLFAAPYPGYVEGVVSSRDGGRSWSPDPRGQPGDSRPLDTIRKILAGGTDPQRVLAAGDDGVWRSDDAGGTWQLSSTGILAAAPGSVAVAPDDVKTVFCPVSGQLLRSRDHGVHWRAMRSVLHTVGSTVVADPVRPGVLYLFDPDVDLGLMKSTDGGRTWADVTPSFGGGVFVDVTAFAVDPHAPDTLYLSGDLYAGSQRNPYIQRSADGGQTWEPVGNGPASFTALVVDPLHGATIYGIEFADYLWRSDDSGQTWARFGDRLPTTLDGGESLTALAVDPADDHIVYVGTGGNGVYRSTDQGLHFAPMNQGLAAATVRTVIADPYRPSLLYAGADGLGVFRWRPATSTWETLSSGLPVLAGASTHFTGALALDPTGDLLYAATPFGIFRLDGPDLSPR